MEEIRLRELVEAARRGDKQAFEKLYRETERTVYFTCLKLVANEDSAKDMMQDTFMTALNKLGTLDDGAKFPAWINRIAVNKCKDSFKKAAHESIDEQLEQGADFKDDDKFIPEEYVTDESRRQVIMRIINEELSDVQRQAVILYYYDEMSLDEIADVMDCPLKTVSSRLCSAREKIRGAVLIYEKENDDRLHALVPVPVLTKILRLEAQRIPVPDISKILLQADFFSTAAASATNTLTTRVAGGTTKMITGKIIAAIVTGVIAVGGVSTAVLLNKDKEDVKTSTVSSAAESKTEEVTSAKEEVSETAAEEVSEENTESSEAETEDDSDLFFIKDYATLGAGELKYLLPAKRSLENDVFQFRDSGKGEWEETYPAPEGVTAYSQDIISIHYEGYTFFPYMDEKEDGQSDLEFFRDEFFDRTSMGLTFENQDFLGNTPDYIEPISQETVQVLDGREALKIKGYLVVRSFYSSWTKEFTDDKKIYCECVLGDYSRHEAPQRDCFILLEWTDDESEENKERMDILMNEAIKELAYNED